MIFPNIQIIDKKRNIYFYNDTFSVSNRYLYLKKLINKDEAFIIISQNLINLDNVIQYLKFENIKKAKFFIDDVLRYSLDYDTKYHIFTEFLIINNILKKTNIIDYEIFSCELFNHTFPVNVKYADIYLSDWIKNFQHDIVPIKKFKNKISFLNNRADYFRQIFSAMIIDNKEDVFVTLNQTIYLDTIINNKKLPINKFKIEIQKKINSNLLFIDENLDLFKDKFFPIEDGILNNNQQNDSIVYQYIQQSFVNLVGETTFFKEFPYFSEKTIKPILCKRPFILLAVPHTLDFLKTLGFKTFDKWWNEDYDKEQDPVTRLTMIYNVVQNILSKDNEELIKILEEMKDVLDHNYNVIQTLSKKILYDPISNN